MISTLIIHISTANRLADEIISVQRVLAGLASCSSNVHIRGLVGCMLNREITAVWHLSRLIYSV